ncbi:substrate-binding domain-containing protein [Actinomyces qiguomingii]
MERGDGHVGDGQYGGAPKVLGGQHRHGDRQIHGASPRPDSTAFADADALRSALLEAPSIGYSTGPSGRALESMIDGWGLRPALDDRLVRAPAGVPVAELIASGAVSLGFQQRSEFMGACGVKVLGALPADCAVKSVFSMGTAAPDPIGRVAGRLFPNDVER